MPALNQVGEPARHTEMWECLPVYVCMCVCILYISLHHLYHYLLLIAKGCQTERSYFSCKLFVCLHRFCCSKPDLLLHHVALQILLQGHQDVAVDQDTHNSCNTKSFDWFVDHKHKYSGAKYTLSQAMKWSGGHLVRDLNECQRMI